jgi:predicted N-formylglutamate amidohydrolase
MVGAADEVAMSEAWIDITGDPASGMLLIGDHASNHVPDGIALGVAPQVMEQHVAIDIGVERLGRRLCQMLDCPGILGGVSRLVVDLNRDAGAPTLIPARSDGFAIPGNSDLDHAAYEQRLGYFRGYHARIADVIQTQSPKMLISLHSFTQFLATSNDPRPWQIGILYNEDDRAARVALPLLDEAGVVTGDNLPYSGKVLNATMNRHGEANGIAYLGIEVRQDLIDHDPGVEHWAGVLAPMIAQVAREVKA